MMTTSDGMYTSNCKVKSAITSVNIWMHFVFRRSKSGCFWNDS